MSRFSGKCDLYDHIAGTGGWYDKNGNPVTMGQEGVSCYYSDELQDFEAFKRLTNGVIHQHHKIKKIDEWNHDFIKEHCPNFDYLRHEKEVADKRMKSGKKTIVYYTYMYWGTEYTAKEINKKGVYITTDIHFNTLLDLIPYYPYLVSASCGKTVYISNESFVDIEFKDHLQYGFISELDYKKELQEHYLEVCQRYFLKDLDARTKQVSLIFCKPLHNGYYEICLDKAADYMHDPKFVWADGFSHVHWTSPKLEDNGYTLLVSEKDVDEYLREDIKNNNVMIEYVEKCKFERSLE